MGLARSREVAQRLDVLRLAPKQIIVAGTNGKGSTALFAQALLIAQGKRVGTTLSPHLARFNERVLLQGAQATDQSLCEAFAAVEAVREDVPLTYYEYAVLAAAWLFRRAQLDVCVLEVGLGGRLDAINLFDADVAVITNIGLDHQSYLGDTLDAIGAEKVAVCRQRQPVVLGHPQMPASVYEALADSGSAIQQYGRDYWRGTGVGLTVHFADSAPLHSSQEPQIAPHNAATATAAVAALGRRPTQAELHQAATKAINPGRAELRSYRGVPVVLDVAHNPAGAAFLATQLQERFPERRFVACAGFLADKDVAGICRALQAPVARWVITATAGGRGLSAQAAAQATGLEQPIIEANFGSAVERAHALGAGADMMLLIVGSFYQVQAMREFLRKADNI